MSNLKPCPFCGDPMYGSAMGVYTKHFDDKNTGCPLYGVTFRTEEWNSRTKKAQIGVTWNEDSAKGFDQEESIQKLAEEYLDIQGIMYIRISAQVYRLAGKYAGELCGIPDLTILFEDGRYLAVELKSNKGKIRKGQKEWARKLKSNYYVIKSFETFQNLIDNF